ncbi:DUF5801 repeats-in-toxin domain-containing protein [Novosphingobium tardum]|uniref:DUF5801 repeats-in-toxin domain-containing protein n=1 Tax=Novosphingobium tardum TaxID=1538021 RepID=A0ABV8RSR3_9SPHN
MALQIDGTFVYDEGFLIDDNDDDVGAFSTSMQAVLAGLGTLPLPTPGYTGFPQYAEKDDSGFVVTDQQVTDYFLTASSTGAAFSTTTGIATELKVGTTTVYLFAAVDPNTSQINPNAIVGRIGDDPSGDIAFVLMLNETKDGAGIVTDLDFGLVVYAPLVHDQADTSNFDVDTLDLLGTVYLGYNFNTATEVPFENFSGVKSGQDAFAPVVPTSGANTVQLLITGFAGNTVGTVNVSVQGLGTNAQHVDPNESIRIDIVSGLDTSGALTSTFVKDAANIHYTAHANAISATFEIDQLNPTNKAATVSVFAFQDEDTDGAGPDSADYQGTLFPTKAISDQGSAVEIDAEDVRVLNAADQDITADFVARGGTIVADGLGVKVTGLLASEQVKFTSDNIPFDRFVITNTYNGSGPSTFDVGEIHVTTLVGGTDTGYVELGSHVIFEDGGPSIAPSTDTVSLSVADSQLNTPASQDFSTLFGTPDFGPDGEGSVTYKVGSVDGTDSGLLDTETGQKVFLFLEEGAGPDGTDLVVGRVGTAGGAADAGGLIVMTISCDALTGEVTLEQARAVFHDKSDPLTDTVVGFASETYVTLTATVHDSEGANADTSSATANIGLAFTITDDNPVITPQDPNNPTPNDLQVANVDNASDSSSFGLDPGNDAPYSFSILSAPDTDGFSFVTTSSGITGYYDSDGSGPNPSAELYTLTIDQDGNYQFTLTGPIASTSSMLDVTDIKAGGPDTGSIEVGTTDTTGNYVLIDGEPGNINESNGFVGVKNGNLDAGESMIFSLHGSDDALLPVLGLVIGTKSAKASTYQIEIDFHDPNLAPLTYSQTVPKNTALTIDPIGLHADDLIDFITVTKVSGPALKIGLGDITIIQPPNDLTLDFSVRLEDGDHDFTDASFSVAIDGNNDGVYPTLGFAPADIAPAGIAPLDDHSLLMAAMPVV